MDMAAAQILVVEDDLEIQELISVNLARAGYRVQRAADAETAQNLVNSTLPDLILLDWGLPGLSGVDLMRRLRINPRSRELSIIMLTARSEERDKIVGLDAGADDFITKPFSPRELLARITAVLRRRLPHTSLDAIEIDGLRLDPLAHRVTVSGMEVALGPTEFRLLRFLMANPERVHSRNHLLDQVWGDHAFFDDRTVDVHIRRLRVALEPSGRDRLIQTVRGSGYRFSSCSS